MLARRSAAEIAAGKQNLDTLRQRMIQDEIRPGLALGVVTPIVEELVAQALLRDGLQKARGNDLVGIDVIDLHPDDPA